LGNYSEFTDDKLVNIIKTTSMRDEKYKIALEILQTRYYTNMYDTAIKYSMAPQFARNICEKIFENFNGHIMRINRANNLKSSLDQEVIKLARQNYKSNKMSRRVVFTSTVAIALIFCAGIMMLAIYLRPHQYDIEAGTDYTATDNSGQKIIKIGDGTEIRLLKGSDLAALNSINGKRLKADFALKQGDVLFSIRKLTKDEYFNIETADSRISVVGTEFEVLYNNKTIVKVKKGTVKVEELQSTNIYYVHSGEIFISDMLHEKKLNFDKIQEGTANRTINTNINKNGSETNPDKFPDIIKGQ